MPANEAETLGGRFLRGLRCWWRNCGKYLTANLDIMILKDGFFSRISSAMLYRALSHSDFLSASGQLVGHL
jgi:hypothetical protein